MIGRSYVSLARRRRLQALRSLQRADPDNPGWHDWDESAADVDVGNLTPAQLMAYLAKQSRAADTG